MKTNFLAKMLDALTSAYTRKDCRCNNPEQIIETNIGKLFSVLAWGFEGVKEQAELIQLWDDVDNARGLVLDRHGINFGVKRISSDDNFYRLAIRVKLISQLSGGDTDTVIRTVSSLFNVDPADVGFEDIYPSKIAIYVSDENIPQNYKNLTEQIVYIIKRTLPAGVGIRLYIKRNRKYIRRVQFMRGFIYHVHIKSKRVVV